MTGKVSHMAQRPTQTASQIFSAAQWFNTNGAQLLQAMFPDGPPPANVDVEPLVQHDERLVLKLTGGGKTTLLKAFNGDVHTAVVARYREIAVIANLRGSGLIPELLGYNKDGNWILSEFVESEMLEDVITEQNAEGYAFALGAWYARYTDAMLNQGQTEASDWLSYLDQYGAIQRVGLTEEQRDALRNMPIQQRLIAKNDSYLRNFLVDDEGQLVGIDFEKAELKPYGWDIIATGRLLVRMFPHLMLPLTQALVDGWGRGTDMLSADQLLDLTRTFASTTAFTVVFEDTLRQQRRLDAYNRASDKPAAHIQEVPFMTEAMQPQLAENRDRLIAHLRNELRVLEAPSADADIPDRIMVQRAGPEGDLPPPSDHEDAFCATCKGSCCQAGAANMAYIRAPRLERTQAALGLDSLEATIQHYADLLPSEHVEGSCFFHTATGCAIPRDQRSDVCNSYQCEALRSFRRLTRKMQDEDRILMFAANDEGVQRAHVFENGAVVMADASLLTDPT